METSTYRQNGKSYLEIFERSYKALQALQDEYKRIGKKTFLVFDCDLRSDFVLVVEI